MYLKLNKKFPWERLFLDMHFSVTYKMIDPIFEVYRHKNSFVAHAIFWIFWCLLKINLGVASVDLANIMQQLKKRMSK